MTKLSSNSSNIDIFNEKKGEYEKALRNNGYRSSLVYNADNEETASAERKRKGKKNRSRIILWSAQSFYMVVGNKLRSDFFKILKKNYPLSNKLYKIFNTNC